MHLRAHRRLLKPLALFHFREGIVTMRTWRIVYILAALAALPAMAAYSYAIPDDQVDVQRIFYGDTGNFEKAAAVRIEDVIKSTPEYDEIKKNKLERGTGKYWILIEQATDRAVEAINKVASESEYDLFAADGYLDGLDPPIPSVDVTNLVLSKVEES